MNWRTKFILLRPLLYSLIGLVLLLTIPVEARLGGGGGFHSSSSSSSHSSSYSSHSSSRSSGGSSSGSIEGAIFVVLMIFLFVWIAVGILTSAGSGTVKKLDGQVDLKEVDECFSWPIFREFVCLLYAQALQEADRNFPVSGRYLSSQAQELISQRYKNVTRITVGSARLINSRVTTSSQFLYVVIESNYWQGQTSFANRETWTFFRPTGSLSFEPEQLIRLGCPKCGFSGEAPGGICPACSSKIEPKASQWRVCKVTIDNSETFRWQPPSPGGREAALVIHPRLRASQEAFLVRYPGFALDDFQAQVSQAFYDLQKAWSEGELKALRPYETDSLYQMHSFWLDYYQRQGQRNRLDKVQLHSAYISNIVHDHYYDAITVHIVASMIDLTVDSTGKVLFGDEKQATRFGEYWTFIRRAGFEEKQSERGRCPSCGGDLSGIRQTGECEHCGNLLTLGNFGWVLSCIEQEEAYHPLG